MCFTFLQYTCVQVFLYGEVKPHLLHVIDFHLLVVEFDHYGHVQCLCHFQ